MEHLPADDLADGLANYHLVTYDNIDEDKFYFVSVGHDDYLGKVVLKDDYIINIDFTMKHYHIQDGWRYHIGKLTAEKEQVVNGEIHFYEYVYNNILNENYHENQNQNQNSSSNLNMNMGMGGGGMFETITQRLNKPSYILPAGTVAHRVAPVSFRTTPPFFRKTTRAKRVNRRRSTRRSKKQKRATRKRR